MRKAHKKLTEKIRELLKKRCIGYLEEYRENYVIPLSRRRQGFESPLGRIHTGKLPVDLLNEIHRFKGSNTYHLERAMRLHLKILKETV